MILEDDHEKLHRPKEPIKGSLDVDGRETKGKPLFQSESDRHCDSPSIHPAILLIGLEAGTVHSHHCLLLEDSGRVCLLDNDFFRNAIFVDAKGE